MAFDNVSQWSVTPSLNTEIGGITLDGNITLINQLDDIARNLMAQVKAQFLDDQFYVADNTDPTKKLAFDLSGLTTATERTLKVPNASGTIALEGTVDRRDRIVNGAKQVSQENGQSAGANNGRYLSDQNAMYFVTSAGAIAGVNVLTISPAGGYRDRITITTADVSLAAGEYLTYTQNLEGSNVRDLKWGTASAVAAVARIGFKGPAGTYAYRLGNSAANRSYVALFTTSAGEANTDVVREFAIPGDTSGTWLNGDGVIGITRDIVLACGSTFQGAAGWQAGNILGTSGVSNGMGTGAAVFEFFDEGFKADPSGTGVYGAYEVPGNAVWECFKFVATGTIPTLSRPGYAAGSQLTDLIPIPRKMAGAITASLPVAPTVIGSTAATVTANGRDSLALSQLCTGGAGAQVTSSGGTYLALARLS